MPNRYESFPGEILDEIFKHLKRESNLYSILQCMLVCKKWKLPAQRSCYSEIIFHNSKEIMDLIFALYNRDVDSSPGRFTRCLAYNGFDETVKMKKTWIDYFIDIFPNARHVYSENDDTEYFSALIKAHESGKWIDMESIGTCHEDSTQIHNTCALLNQKTIKILNVHDSLKLDMTYNLYYQLHLFNKVEELFLETNQHTFFQYAEHAIDMNPNLTILSYENLNDIDVNDLIPYKPVDLSLIKPQPKITDLKIQGVCYENDNFLLYLMAKFPKLQRIKINQRRGAITRHKSLFTKIKSVQNNFTAPVLAKFMLFVASCKFFTMELFYTTLSVDKILKNYWSLCDPEEPKLIGFTYSEGTAPSDVEAQRLNSDSVVHICMDVDPLLKQKGLIFNYKPIGANLPHLEVLEKCGKEIDHLILCIDPYKCNDIRSGNSLEIAEMAGGYFLSHTIKHCTHLKTLCIYFSHIFIFTSSHHSCINTSITSLFLERVVISKNILSQISRRLPSLRRLSLKEVACIEEQEEEDDTPLFNSALDMPTTAFRFLYMNNYELEDTCEYNHPTKIMIKLTTKDGDTYYKHAPNVPIRYGTKAVRKRLDDKSSTFDETSDDEAIETATASLPSAIQTDKREYENCLKIKNCANLHIKCKSLNYLVVSMKKVSPAMSFFIFIKDKSKYPNDVLYADEERLRAEYFNADC